MNQSFLTAYRSRRSRRFPSSTIRAGFPTDSGYYRFLAALKTLFDKDDVISIPFRPSQLADQFVPDWYPVSFAYRGTPLSLFFRNRLVSDRTLLLHALRLRVLDYVGLPSPLFTSRLSR